MTQQLENYIIAEMEKISYLPWEIKTGFLRGFPATVWMLIRYPIASLEKASNGSKSRAFWFAFWCYLIGFTVSFVLAYLLNIDNVQFVFTSEIIDLIESDYVRTTLELSVFPLVPLIYVWNVLRAAILYGIVGESWGKQPFKKFYNVAQYASVVNLIWPVRHDLLADILIVTTKSALMVLGVSVFFKLNKSRLIFSIAFLSLLILIFWKSIPDSGVFEKLIYP